MNVRFLLGSLFFAVAVASANAQLSWEKTEVDLQPKAGEQKAVAEFKYTNKTNHPINIKNVKTSCGCTVASLKKNDVAPGESGEVTATLNIGGRSGLQQKFVTVETDDPAQPMINLTLKANITPAMEVQPPLVYWKVGEEPKPKTITVKAAKDVPITKLDVMSSSPEFTAKVEKGSAPGEFKVDVQPKSTEKVINGALTLKPDFPEAFYATVRVMEGKGVE